MICGFGKDNLGDFSAEHPHVSTIEDEITQIRMSLAQLPARLGVQRSEHDIVRNLRSLRQRIGALELIGKLLRDVMRKVLHCRRIKTLVALKDRSDF